MELVLPMMVACYLPLWKKICVGGVIWDIFEASPITDYLNKHSLGKIQKNQTKGSFCMFEVNIIIADRAGMQWVKLPVFHLLCMMIQEGL